MLLAGDGFIAETVASSGSSAEEAAVVAGAVAAGASGVMVDAVGAPGSGALRQLRHLEISDAQLLRSCVSMGFSCWSVLQLQLWGLAVGPASLGTLAPMFVSCTLSLYWYVDCASVLLPRCITHNNPGRPQGRHNG